VDRVDDESATHNCFVEMVGKSGLADAAAAVATLAAIATPGC